MIKLKNYRKLRQKIAKACARNFKLIFTKFKIIENYFLASFLSSDFEAAADAPPAGVAEADAVAER